jgi:hypothetical protein
MSTTYQLDTATSRANPTPVPLKRLTVPAIQRRKGAEPLVMLTAYTARMAQLLDTHCDLLLVGDSLGQVIYGLPSTLGVTLDMMCAHGAAVVRGSYHALVVIDMPFGAYEASPEAAFASASRIMAETGAAAVKLEGGEAMAPTIAFLTQRGIPVMAHIGLTPQAVNVLGGYGARGRTNAEHAKIVVLDGARRGARTARPRGNRRSFVPGDRYRRVGGLRRSGAGDRGHAGAVRPHRALREALRRHGRPHFRRGRRLCGRGESSELSDARADLRTQGVMRLSFRWTRG